MARRSFSLIGGKVMRLTRLDGCGNPAYSDTARIVTDGFISIAATAVINEGEAVVVTNANGRTCASRPAKPSIDGYTVAVELCGVDPDVVNFTTTQPTVLNGSGDVAGFDVDTDADPSSAGFALEVWTEIGVDEACAPGQETRYGYVILPFMQGGVVGDFTIANEAINFSLTQASSRKGHSWGTGPYLVDLDGAGDPVALAAIAPSVALRVLEVSAVPPESTSGAIPLDDPDAAAATGADAGTPGAFTPSGAFRPETVADMGGVTANPATAWTTGQYVLLQGGGHAYWDGDSWEAGEAP